MKHLSLTLAILAGVSIPPPPALAAGPAAKADSAVCAELNESYEEASKRLAMTDAQAIADLRPGREVRRETESASILAEAAITLDLLMAARCRPPSSAPSGKRYYTSALRCQNAILEAQLSGAYRFPPACERARWVPER